MRKNLEDKMPTGRSRCRWRCSESPVHKDKNLFPQNILQEVKQGTILDYLRHYGGGERERRKERGGQYEGRGEGRREKEEKAREWR